ncbi:MAG: EAL domain-containing protein [Methylobacter sp.]|nr:EAL domain-containing protein [Methylobacter sp.]
MTNTLNLDQDGMAVLLDIHDILMTWNASELSVLQKVCEKLRTSLHLDLVWGGLISPNNNLSISAAAGVDAEQVTGTQLTYSDAFEPCRLRQCIDSVLPVYLTDGLIALNSLAFDQLSEQTRTLPTVLYPLKLNGACVGILGISTKKPQQQKQHEQVLLQLTAQHAGFALGMLRSFVAKDNDQGNLKLAAAVFDSSLEGIFITDTVGTILAANAACGRITGYDPQELIGKNPRVLKSDHHGEEFYTALWKTVRQQNQWEGEIWNKRKNGDIFPQWLSISAIKNEQDLVQNYIGIFIDISKQKAAERHLAYLAYHDQLTELPNRDLFHDRLNMAVLQAKRSQQNIAVLFIDLDHFKYINDTFGHAIGDQLLQQVALKLASCLREQDTLARMGGDEFTVILQEFNNRQDVELAARRILDTLDTPFLVDHHALYVSASIGISFFPEDGNDASELMKRADTAMYSAKNDGRRRLHFFQASMEGYSLNRVAMEQHLRIALEQNEFMVFYQPQINLNSGRIVGAEALLRWHRPGIGLIPPNQFIPLAEDTGLILPIGEWVLRETCKQHKLWTNTRNSNLRIGVNLSGHQFKQANLSTTVANILQETGMNPKFLDLELTESVAMQDVYTSLRTLKTLKHAGVQISIDDFGTGYSSLSYLKQFPIDRLKIDQSFVADIASDPNSAAIVLAIIAMSHSLGLDVIAEGVETQEQLQFLKMHGCNEVQGYLFGRPMPADEFSKFLSQWPDLKS